MVKLLLIFVFGFFYIYAVEKHGDHYLEWLNTSSFQEFSARKTGYVTFDENNKPSFLEFNSDQDIQLVSSFCPVSCCLNNKKPDKSFLNRAMWSRVLRGDSGGFVSVSSPEVSSVADVFEVWERYVAPQSDYVYGVNFLGHISLKKEPQNFVEFYSANKWEKNFPQILENAVLKKAPFLFFNAKDNDNDEENQYMFDCFLGSGVQGIVARAFKINDPSCVIAVKMFGFRLDDSFGTIIDIIANEIIGRKIANKNMTSQLLYPKSQSICGRESLIMEYIDGCTLKEFYKKNPNLSKEQTDYFEKNLKLVLPTHDLTDTNVMVRLNKESGLYDIVQIDLALLQL